MILVAGGTGRLGRLVVHRLADRGLPVTVLTRDPDRAAGLPAGVLVGDVRRPLAFGQVDVVVAAVHGFAGPGGGTPRTVDRDGNANLVDAAKAAGADVVMLSVQGAAADHPMLLHRMKYAAELSTGFCVVRCPPRAGCRCPRGEGPSGSGLDGIQIQTRACSSQ